MAYNDGLILEITVRRAGSPEPLIHATLNALGPFHWHAPSRLDEIVVASEEMALVSLDYDPEIRRLNLAKREAP